MRYLTLGQPDTVSNFKYLLYQSSHPFLYELTGFRQVYGLNLCSCIKPLHTVVQHDIILHWIHCSDVHWSALHCTALFKSLFSLLHTNLMDSNRFKCQILTVRSCVQMLFENYWGEGTFSYHWQSYSSVKFSFWRHQQLTSCWNPGGEQVLKDIWPKIPPTAGTI